MAHALPPSEDMLNFVAELRAVGLSWDKAAARIKRTQAECGMAPDHFEVPRAASSESTT